MNYKRIKQAHFFYCKSIVFCILVLINTLLLSCNEEVFEKTTSEQNVKMNKVSFEEIKQSKNRDVIAAIGKVKTKSMTNRIIYDSINDFYFDDENGIKLETSDKESYTFKVERTNGDQKLENIVFNKNLMTNEIETFLVKYDYTLQQIEQNPQLALESFSNTVTNLESKSTACVATIVLCHNDGNGGYADMPHIAGPACYRAGNMHMLQISTVSTECGSGNSAGGGHTTTGATGSSTPAGGGSNPITTPNGGNSNVIANPCNKIKNQNSTFPSLKQSLVALAATTSQNYENGIFIDNTATSSTPNPVQNIPSNTTNGGSIPLNMTPTNSYVILAHTHDSYGPYGTGTYSIFSWDDLTTINNLLVNNHIDNSNFVFYVITADGTRYALTIENPSELSGFFYDPSNLPFGTQIDMEKINKLDLMFKTYYDRYKGGLIHTMSNPDNDKKNFLKFIREANLGITLFEVDATFTNYQKLSISKSGVVTPTPCN